MARILIAPIAEADAAEIWAYIAQDNSSAADRLLTRFDQVFRELSEQPHIGRIVDELAPNLRLFPVGSYLVFYRPLSDGIEVARVLHGARDITAEFFRE